MKKGTFDICVLGERESVTGYISDCGIWGIDKRSKGEWIITHLPTGSKAMPIVSNFQRAKRIVTKLAEQTELWNIGKFGKIPKSARGNSAQLKARQEAWKIE